MSKATTWILALAMPLAACGSPDEPLTSSEVLSEIQRNGFNLSAQSNPMAQRAGYEMVRVCLVEFDSKNRCPGIGFNLLAFDVNNENWKAQKNQMMQMFKGQSVEVNFNVAINGYDDHVNSTEMRKIIEIFKNL